MSSSLIHCVETLLMMKSILRTVSWQMILLAPVHPFLQVHNQSRSQILKKRYIKPIYLRACPVVVFIVFQLRSASSEAFINWLRSECFIQ